MYAGFFAALRDARVPVSLREYLGFLEALDAGVVEDDAEGFYHLARASLVKDERHIDRFDRAFAAHFRGLEGLSVAAIVQRLELPEAWLRQLVERYLSPEEKAEIEAMGGFERLMQALAERLRRQEGRHEGGATWIGTAGTSPFGALGHNPEGVRIGQDDGREGRAVKVWDRREFQNLDDGAELGTRTLKLALRRLRRWAREGAAEELDLGGTIRRTAEQGWLDVVTRPERRNAVKVLLFLDVGGSMDPHVRLVEGLFSAARAEFRHLEQFYFHNCPYEGVWRDNRRRWDAQVPTAELLRRYGPDHRVLFVGDAAMSPYEIAAPGGAAEHWNSESGETWLNRMLDAWPKAIWLNPAPEAAWRHAGSTAMIATIFGGRMYPLTLAGLDAGIRELAR
jgi:uncharacterized protein with von Willebrand factor type A (vWA) domain